MAAVNGGGGDEGFSSQAEPRKEEGRRGGRGGGEEGRRGGGGGGEEGERRGGGEEGRRGGGEEGRRGGEEERRRGRGGGGEEGRRGMWCSRTQLRAAAAGAIKAMWEPQRHDLATGEGSGFCYLVLIEYSIK